jgi:hypothetical protein
MMKTRDPVARRVLERTGAESEQQPASIDIEIDAARRRLFRAEAAGVEELLTDTLQRMRETLAEFEDDRALVARLVERLIALRDQECGVSRILQMRIGE